MTNKHRISIYLCTDLYKEYREIEYTYRKTKKYIYRYICIAINVLYKYTFDTNDLNFDTVWCNRIFLNEILDNYNNDFTRTSLTLTDDVFFKIMQMKRLGYDINIYINYALWIRIRYYKKNGH